MRVDKHEGPAVERDSEVRLLRDRTLLEKVLPGELDVPGGLEVAIERCIVSRPAIPFPVVVVAHHVHVVEEFVDGCDVVRGVDGGSPRPDGCR